MRPAFSNYYYYCATTVDLSACRLDNNNNYDTSAAPLRHHAAETVEPARTTTALHNPKRPIIHPDSVPFLSLVGLSVLHTSVLCARRRRRRQEILWNLTLNPLVGTTRMTDDDESRAR